ncbi:hypothetical protein CSUI_006710 [Cystoisospora suis]|uniref:Uncharacterized protein n=1 Tax=Cystoisospora suis TaxID=483139 RepID=A0A2C6KT62_9APIC|nr:hypothetical protein CSUI_006710 [Cystoisospora suis]
MQLPLSELWIQQKFPVLVASVYFDAPGQAEGHGDGRRLRSRPALELLKREALGRLKGIVAAAGSLQGFSGCPCVFGDILTRNPALIDEPQTAVEEAFQEAANILESARALLPPVALEAGKRKLSVFLEETVNTLEELRSSIAETKARRKKAEELEPVLVVVSNFLKLHRDEIKDFAVVQADILLSHLHERAQHLAQVDVQQIKALLDSLSTSKPGFTAAALEQASSLSLTHTKDLDILLATVNEIMNAKGPQIEQLLRDANEKAEVAKLAGLSVTDLKACQDNWGCLKASNSVVVLTVFPSVSLNYADLLSEFRQSDIRGIVRSLLQLKRGRRGLQTASCERIQSVLPTLESSLRARLPDRARALETRAVVLLEQRKTLNVKMNSLRSLKEAQDNVGDELSPAVPVATSKTRDAPLKRSIDSLLPLSEAACTELVEEIKRFAAERLELLERVDELENDYARLYRDQEVKHTDEKSYDAKGWRQTAFQVIQSDAISQELHEKEAFWQLAASFCQALEAQLEVPWSQIGEGGRTDSDSVLWFCTSWEGKQRLAEKELQSAEDVMFLRALITPQLKALRAVHTILSPLAAVLSTHTSKKREQDKTSQALLSREIWTEFCFLVDLPVKAEGEPVDRESLKGDNVREGDSCEAEWGPKLTLRHFRARLHLLQERQNDIKNLAHRAVGEIALKETLEGVTQWLDSAELETTMEPQPQSQVSRNRTASPRLFGDSRESCSDNRRLPECPTVSGWKTLFATLSDHQVAIASLRCLRGVSQILQEQVQRKQSRKNTKEFERSDTSAR